MPRQILYEKIEARVDKMIELGLVNEVKKLLDIGCNKNSNSMQAIGYKEIIMYLDGQIDLAQAIELIKKNTRHYAKRQLTWFKHQTNGIWIDKNNFKNETEIVNYVYNLCQKNLWGAIMIYDFMKNNFDIDGKILELGQIAQQNISHIFEKIDATTEYNQMKILHAMQKNKLSESHFNFSTGYGYNDFGRDTLEKIYADIFHTEDALVRIQIVSGTHALFCAMSGNLNHGDELIYVCGTPYDTLQSIIGIKKSPHSLIARGINYKQIELKSDGDFDYDAIKNSISPQTKMIAIQRSRGYSLRKSINISQIKKLIAFVKNIRDNIICLVDNCYGEFVEEFEPSDFGADLTVGSLIKNPGGGIAKVGGYIVGKKNMLTAPHIL